MIDARTVWRLCLVCVLVGVLGLLLTWQASAHSWYPISCCSGRDCMAVPHEAIRVTPEGYVIVVTGELIPWGDKRVKFTPAEQEDGRGYHWCRHLSGPNKGRTICLFVPQGGA